MLPAIPSLSSVLCSALSPFRCLSVSRCCRAVVVVVVVCVLLLLLLLLVCCCWDIVVMSRCCVTTTMLKKFGRGRRRRCVDGSVVVGGCFVGVADDVAVPLSSPVSSSLPNTASQTAVGYCVLPSSRWVVCSACHALLACSWQTVCRSRNNKGTLGTTLQVACKPRGHVSLGGSCAAVGGGAYVRKWRRWRSQSSHKSRYTKPCPPPTTTTTTSRSSSISFHDEQNDVEPLCQHALQLR